MYDIFDVCGESELKCSSKAESSSCAEGSEFDAFSLAFDALDVIFSLVEPQANHRLVFLNDYIMI